MPYKTRKSFRISGRVIDREARHGVAELRIEAWDKGLICDDLVGSAIAGQEGSFRIG